MLDVLIKKLYYTQYVLNKIGREAKGRREELRLLLHTTHTHTPFKLLREFISSEATRNIKPKSTYFRASYRKDLKYFKFCIPKVCLRVGKRATVAPPGLLSLAIFFLPTKIKMI